MEGYSFYDIYIVITIIYYPSLLYIAIMFFNMVNYYRIQFTKKEGATVSKEHNSLQFVIRHNDQFLQDKFILVFNNDATRKFFESQLQGSTFEEVTSDMAQHAARIGINGKVVPYGYTMKLTAEEKKKLSTANWDETAQLLAEGNERLHKAAVEKTK